MGVAGAAGAVGAVGAMGKDFDPLGIPFEKAVDVGRGPARECCHE
jgi:hypothetical protein